MTEKAIEMIEKNTVFNKQYERKIWRKIRSKGFSRTYGRSVSLAMETFIARRYAGMSFDEIADHYEKRHSWFRYMTSSAGREYLRRFLIESDAPMFYKAYIATRRCRIERAINNCENPLDSLIEAIAPSVSEQMTVYNGCASWKGDANDPNAVDEAFAAISGKAPAESLIVFSLFGVEMSQKIICRLVDEERYAVVEYLLSHREAIDRIMPGMDFIAMVMEVILCKLDMLYSCPEAYEAEDNYDEHGCLRLLNAMERCYPAEFREFFSRLFSVEFWGNESRE